VNLIKEYAKTFAAFVAGVVGNAVVALVNGSTPWPQTGAEWLQYAVTSVGAAVAVWLTRNKITQKQLDKDPNVVGGVVTEIPGPTGTVIEGNIKVAPGTYQNPWK
jgi:uncharacterized membrane protein YeaQ/YmgE (transglycosylase-associated protein family)